MGVLVHLNSKLERQKDIVTDITRKVSLSALDTLEFDVAYEQEINKYDYVYYLDKTTNLWYEYTVTSIDTAHGSEGVVKSIYAENSIIDLKHYAIIDEQLKDRVARDALDTALRETGWSVGHVDYTEQKDISFNHMSVYDAISNIIETYSLELSTSYDPTNEKNKKIINLYKHVGANNGRRFEYTNDMSDVKRSINMDEVSTAIYPFGKGEQLTDENGSPTGEYGQRINISQVNGNVLYVSDEDARIKYGIWNPNTQKRMHRFSFATFDDIEDPSELKEKALELLEESKEPKISYEANVIDLKQYGYNFQSVSIGDTVVLIDDLIKMRVNGRITEITYGPDGSIDIKMGNIGNTLIDSKNNLGKISNKVSDIGIKVDQVQNKVVTSKVNIQEIFDEIGSFFESSNSYVDFSKENGIVITNDQDPDKATFATQIVSGGIRIANSKLPNGEWDWNVVIAEGQIGSDLIGAEQIKANSITSDHIRAGAITADDITIGEEASKESLTEFLENSDKNNKAYIDEKINESNESIARTIDETNTDLTNSLSEVYSYVDESSKQYLETMQTIQLSLEERMQGLNEADTNIDNQLSQIYSDLDKLRAELEKAGVPQEIIDEIISTAKQNAQSIATEAEERAKLYADAMEENLKKEFQNQFNENNKQTLKNLDELSTKIYESVAENNANIEDIKTQFASDLANSSSTIMSEVNKMLDELSPEDLEGFATTDELYETKRQYEEALSNFNSVIDQEFTSKSEFEEAQQRLIEAEEQYNKNFNDFMDNLHEVTAELENVKTVISTDNNGRLVLSNPTSDFSLALDNDRLSIENKDGGTLAYFGAEKFFINNGQINDKLYLGNYYIMVDADGTFSINYKD